MSISCEWSCQEPSLETILAGSRLSGSFMNHVESDGWIPLSECMGGLIGGSCQIK